MPFDTPAPLHSDEKQAFDEALDPRKADGIFVERAPEPEPLSNVEVGPARRRPINLDQLNRELAVLEKRNLSGATPKPRPVLLRPKPLVEEEEEEELPDISSGKERKCKILCSGDWLTQGLVTRIISRWNLSLPMSSIVKDTNQQLKSTCRQAVEEVDIYSILLIALEDEANGISVRGRETIKRNRGNAEMNLATFRRFMVEWRRGSPNALIAAKCLPYSNDSFVRKLFTQLNTRLRIERREEELNKDRRLKSPILDSRITQHARRTIIGDRVYVVIPMRNIPPELLHQMNGLPHIDLKVHDTSREMPHQDQVAALTAPFSETNEQRLQRLANQIQKMDSAPRTFEDITIPEAMIGPAKDTSPDMAMSGEEIDFDNMSIDELFKEPTDGDSN